MAKWRLMGGLLVFDTKLRKKTDCRKLFTSFFARTSTRPRVREANGADISDPVYFGVSVEGKRSAKMRSVAPRLARM